MEADDHPQFRDGSHELEEIYCGMKCRFTENVIYCRTNCEKKL